MKVRAAIERKTFERGTIFFRFGSSPFRSPLCFGDEHPIFAVLLLPHRAASEIPSEEE